MRAIVEHLNSQTAFRRFLDHYSQDTRKLIVFCGAGASKEANLPDWDELVRLVRAELDQPVYSADDIKRKVQKFDYEDDFWNKFSIAKDIMGANYSSVIEPLLRTTSPLPSFYRHIWKLRVSGLVTMNLDGLAQRGYVETEHKLPQVLTGKEAFHAKNAFLGTSGPTIVELHGNIDKPGSWILTKEDYLHISGDEAYRQFLRNIYSNSIVLIYGLSAGDASVSGQLEYLNDIRSSNGHYYLLKREPATEQDHSLAKELGIQLIYLPVTESWEKGFESFAEYVHRYKPKDPHPDVVLSDSAANFVLPPAADLLTETPDEVRKKLNAASKGFQGDETKFSAFKEEYDLAINHAARIKLGTENSEWLGRKIISERGAGNFGRVFQAEDGVGGTVAIKIAHEAVRDNPVMLNSFRRGVSSMRYISKSQIAGVVRIIDASELPPSIIMEFVNGVNLEEAINQDYISTIEQRLLTIIRVCKIVHSCHTHEKAILHRDLRPQNIMIGGEFWERIDYNEIKVLDFDLSWFEGAVGQDYYMPASSALGYLAPEQIDPRSKWGARSGLVDVYGLAMLLYFALSKQHPSAAASEREDWRTRVGEASAKAYSTTWKSLPNRVTRLIMDATHPVQEARPLLENFILRLEQIKEMAAGIFIADADVLLEEIFNRVFPGYDSRDGYIFQNFSGVTMSASTDYANRRYKFTIESIATESASRTNMGKYLSESINKLKDALSTVGAVDRDGSLVGRSRLKVSCSIPIPENFSEMTRLVTAMQTGVQQARIE